jgi:hypothetical protein
VVDFLLEVASTNPDSLGTMIMGSGKQSISWVRGSLFGLLVLALYWLYGWRPFFICTWNVVDDGLYIRNAEAFANWVQWHGRLWLGSFDCFSLAKAPLYGTWLGSLHLLGMPVRVGEFLLVLAGPFLFKSAVRPVTKLEGWKFAVVTVLLVANPMLPEEFRLRREGLHIALTNLCLVAAVGLALYVGRPVRERLPWAAMAGIFLGLCYLDREESTWLSAAVFVAVAITFARAFIEWCPSRPSLRPILRAHGTVLSVLGVAFLLPVLTVCALNQAHYGSFMTTWRRNSAFTGLYQRLTSLEPNGHQAYVPIARVTRLKAYDLSPTFARLKPFLEGTGSYWIAGNNEQAGFNQRSPADKEFFVSYFEFCLLWAAQQAGANSAGQMETMFRAIDRELAEAVRAGKIQAGPHGPAILAARLPGDFKRILSAGLLSFGSLLRVTHDTYAWPLRMLTPQARLDDIARLTHSSLVLYPQPNLHSAREPVFRGIKWIQRIVFPGLFLALFALLVWRRKDVFTLAPSTRGFYLWSLAIPLGGLAAFCLGMGVVNVLGFEILRLGGYIDLGLAPLSVLCACVFVGLVLKEPASARLEHHG